MMPDGIDNHRSHNDHPHPDQHDNQHSHAHDHEHSHGSPTNGHHHDGHDRAHEHGTGFVGWIRAAFHWHGHSHHHGSLAADKAFAANREAIQVVWLALAALLLTSVLQLAIVYLSGSVALLADTIHNIGDGLNSVPLLIAFYLARRVATRRYTYGFGRAEDVAGIFIVLSIAASAGVVFWESFQKLLHPEPMTNLGWVVVASLLGFLGNEAVAILQIRTGRKIGSAAMVADGLHARTDGLTSLSVLLAAAGTQLGFPILDPVIGIMIGIAILFITRDATRAMWYRLMDAIEPEYMDQAESVLARHPGVLEVRRLRMRWIGHRLHAEVVISVDPNLTTRQSHDIAEEARHELFHHMPNLSEIVVHVEPGADKIEDVHALTTGHEPVPQPLD